MFFLVDTFKRIRTMPVLKENKRLLLFFLAASLLFALYMWLVEGLSLLDTYYFLVTTATTVGYGYISPKTGLGKIFVTVYMIIGIALLGLFLGKVTEFMVEVGSKRKKGLISMKGQVDLIIAGYPSVLILANDSALVESDDLSTSICAVVERMRPEIRAIVEKVRKDELLFEIVNADTIVDVASPSVLAQEILDQGAIELQNAIFSTHTAGTQYNLSHLGEEMSWAEVAMALLHKDAIPEGFQNPGDKGFNLLPKQGDVVKQGALIKYRGTVALDNLA